MSSRPAAAQPFQPPQPGDKWALNFYAIYIGQFFSSITSTIVQYSFLWYITDIYKSATYLAFGTMIGIFPTAIIAPFVGPFIDRCNKKVVMIVFDAIVAATAGVFALYYVMHPQEQPSIMAIYLVCFIRAVASSVLQPTLSSVTPSLVPKSMITKVTSQVGSLMTLSWIIAQAVSAALYSFLALEVIILLDILGFILATALLIPSRVPSNLAAADTSPTTDTSPSTATLPTADTSSVNPAPALNNAESTAPKKPKLIADMLESFAILRHNRGMFRLILINGFLLFGMISISSLFPLLTTIHFKGSINEAAAIEMIWVGAMFLTGIVVGVIGIKISRVKMFFLSSGILNLCVLVSGALPGIHFFFYVYFVLSFIGGIGESLAHTTLNSLILTKYKPEEMGRVSSIATSIATIASPLGLAVVGPLADLIGVNWTFVGAAVICFIPMIFMRTDKQLWHLDDTPSPH
jgi:DHA3 family macrolide efflux protein-like MFS transporter